MKKTSIILSLLLVGQLPAMQNNQITLLQHPASYAIAGFALGSCAGIAGHRWYYGSQPICYIQMPVEVPNELEAEIDSESDSSALTASQRTELGENKRILLKRCKHPVFKYFLQQEKAIENEPKFRGELEKTGLTNDPFLLECYDELKTIDAARCVIHTINDSQLELCVGVGNYLQSKTKPRRRTADSLSRSLQEVQKMLQTQTSK